MTVQVTEMKLSWDEQEFRALLRQVVSEVTGLGDWPPGRVLLTEDEAARACGVKRHVLRDLRLEGKITASKLGLGIKYSRADLLQVIEFAKQAALGHSSNSAKGGHDGY